MSNSRDAGTSMARLGRDDEHNTKHSVTPALRQTPTAAIVGNPANGIGRRKARITAGPRMRQAMLVLVSMKQRKSHLFLVLDAPPYRDSMLHFWVILREQWTC